MNEVWLQTLQQLFTYGTQVSPRGQLTMELPQHTVCVSMRSPVLTVPARKLSYKFMAAEAYWILSGDDTVAGIAPWNKHISQFSDNGETFFGAYGPKIRGQLDYVVAKLLADPDSRQAGLTIWRENPPATKDVPCTVAIFANLRGGQLNLHVFMRSSDVWLGLPYDVFNFSMLAHLICSRLNVTQSPLAEPLAIPGVLYLTAASSHLYEQHFEPALALLKQPPMGDPVQGITPMLMYHSEQYLMDALKLVRDSAPGDLGRWWEIYD
jgi:thymidylate synthase